MRLGTKANDESFFLPFIINSKNVSQLWKKGNGNQAQVSQKRNLGQMDSIQAHTGGSCRDLCLVSHSLQEKDVMLK